MQLRAWSPSSGEEQEAGSTTPRPWLRHPRTSQHLRPHLLHASPTAGLELRRGQPRPPRLSLRPSPHAASSQAAHRFHCLSAASVQAQQSSAPSPLYHSLSLSNRLGTRLAESRTPRPCPRPGQGRGFCWPHPWGRGQSLRRSGAASAGLGLARLGSVCSSGGGGRLG